MTTDEALRIRDGDVRKEYARGHPLLVSLTVFAFIGGTVTLMVPDVVGESSIGTILIPPLRWAWSVLYVAGGGGVLYALWVKVTHPHTSVRIEATALCLLSSCYAVYCLAIFANRGLSPGVLAGSTFGGLAVGCLTRAWLIVTDRQAPWRQRRT